MKNYIVTLRLQHPAWDEVDGLTYYIRAEGRPEAIKRARLIATTDGNLDRQKKGTFSATINPDQSSGLDTYTGVNMHESYKKQSGDTPEKIRWMQKFEVAVTSRDRTQVGKIDWRFADKYNSAGMDVEAAAEKYVADHHNAKAYMQTIPLSKWNAYTKVRLEEGVSLFSDAQLDTLRKHFGNIKKVDPESKTFLSLREFINGLDNARLKQLRDSKIPWLYYLAGRKLKESETNESVWDLPLTHGDSEEFAGWIAHYGGKKLEIKKDQAKDLWGAKQLALKALKVPKSKAGLLAIVPAYECIDEGLGREIKDVGVYNGFGKNAELLGHVSRGTTSVGAAKFAKSLGIKAYSARYERSQDGKSSAWYIIKEDDMAENITIFNTAKAIASSHGSSGGSNQSTTSGIYHNLKQWKSYAKGKGYSVENGGDGKLYAVTDGDEVGTWDPKYGGSGHGWFNEDAAGVVSAGTNSASVPTGPESMGVKVKPDDKFGKHDVFDCDNATFANCIKGKKKHQRWTSYLGKDHPLVTKTSAWKNKNFIMRNSSTGEMLFARTPVAHSFIKESTEFVITPNIKDRINQFNEWMSALAGVKINTKNPLESINAGFKILRKMKHSQYEWKLIREMAKLTNKLGMNLPAVKDMPMETEL